ncbi:LysR substrate-binding domain-containing protein [Prosthecomicrobium sp. N25]|uniref:LysR substrate-binding domain-containing protein n=1 Tax=Prosthecomicrobium sp. N25 TaxID=3129254 RepID=UPI003078739A
MPTQAGQNLEAALQKGFAAVAEGFAAPCGGARTDASRSTRLRGRGPLSDAPAQGPARDRARRGDPHLDRPDRRRGRLPRSSDCGIVFVTTASLGRAAIRLAAETVVPVASPTLSEGLGGAPSSTPRFGQLLHLETETGAWLDWPAYAERAGLPRPDAGAGLAFNNHQLLIEAALTGEGVALGWRPLVDGLVQAGRLVPVGPAVTRHDAGYFLLQPTLLPADPGLAALLHTVRADFAATMAREIEPRPFVRLIDPAPQPSA